MEGQDGASNLDVIQQSMKVDIGAIKIIKQLRVPPAVLQLVWVVVKIVMIHSTANRMSKGNINSTSAQYATQRLISLRDRLLTLSAKSACLNSALFVEHQRQRKTTISIHSRSPAVCIFLNSKTTTIGMVVDIATEILITLTIAAHSSRCCSTLCSYWFWFPSFLYCWFQWWLA